MSPPTYILPEPAQILAWRDEGLSVDRIAQIANIPYTTARALVALHAPGSRVRPGRPTLSPKKADQARKLRREGYSMRAIARQLRIGLKTLQTAIEGIPTPPLHEMKMIGRAHSGPRPATVEIVPQVVQILVESRVLMARLGKRHPEFQRSSFHPCRVVIEGEVCGRAARGHGLCRSHLALAQKALKGGFGPVGGGDEPAS